MLIKKATLSVSLLLISLSSYSVFASPQKKSVEPKPVQPLVRTTSKHERRRFPYGSTLTISGAPAGSITIEAWPNAEIDISVEIQLQGGSEQDLDRLALVNNVLIDEDANHIRIMTTGTHDKSFMKAIKKFPKELLAWPWKVDFRIRVPVATDLDINTGRGPITISDVEGDIQLSAAESDLKMRLSGGGVNAIVAAGKISLDVPARSWRRGSVDLRVAAGDVTVQLPAGFSADFDAEVLRTGAIVDSYGALEARDKPGITPRLIKARTGAGGTSFRFTVGDGTITIKKQ
jgi:hypothetical protein